MVTIQDETQSERWLTCAQVRERYGHRSHMWIERRLKLDPDFPRPSKFGRLRFWRLADLVVWERRRAAKAA